MDISCLGEKRNLRSNFHHPGDVQKLEAGGEGRVDDRMIYLKGNAWLAGHLPDFGCTSIIKLER